MPVIFPRKIWQSERYVALKIGNCQFKDAESAAFELKVERRIAQTNDIHKGFSCVRTCIDSFQEKGSHGIHLCLVYEPMREPLWLFQQRFRRRKFPLALLKGYVKLLLQGLDYLHSECNVIHTGKLHPLLPFVPSTPMLIVLADLKTDNILVGFEKSSVVKDFAHAQAANPMPRKVKDGRSIYVSHHDFGPLRSYYILPKITDFGLAHMQGNPSQLNRHPIQPDHYRAPEVILGAGWSYSVDIWNLGVLVRRVLRRMIWIPGHPNRARCGIC
jgi:serine/threonine-protein kinase SRPK3